MSRVLSTVRSDPANLVDSEGQPYPVAPEPEGSGVVPPLYSVLLRPGDLGQADNVFTSWTALYDACKTVAGGVRVVCDDTLAPINIPAGHYVIDNWRFDSEPSFVNTNGGAVVTLDDGVVLDPGVDGNLTFTLGPWVYFNATATTTPPVTLVAGEYNVILEPFSGLQSVGAHPFFNVTGAVAATYLWLYLQNAEIGDSNNHTIAFSPGAGGQINMVSGEVHTKALTGAGIAGLDIFLDNASNVEQPNGAATQTNVSDAGHTLYVPASAANWNNSPPATVAAALDRIAAKIGPIP